MMKPMVYLEEGCTGWCGGLYGFDVWMEPGWYEVLLGFKDLVRDVEMIVFKDDIDPEYTGLTSAARSPQWSEIGIEFPFWQNEDLPAAYLDTETISSLRLQLDTLTRAPHPLHQEPPHDLSASSCDVSTDTHTDEKDERL